MRWIKTAYAPLDRLIDSAAGFDEKVLEAYGSPTDFKRRRNIGRAIVVSTAVGSLGWAAKILLSLTGPLAWGLAVIVGVLYAVLSYSLESFFAANVNVYASMRSKLFSLTLRSLLSAIIAASAALPWVSISLSSSIRLELAKMTLERQTELRTQIDSAFGTSEMNQRSSTLREDLKSLEVAMGTLPPAVQSVVNQALACNRSLDTLTQEIKSRQGALINRESLLQRRLQGDVSTAVRQQTNNEIAAIRREASKLSKDLDTKRQECRGFDDVARVEQERHFGDVRSRKAVLEKAYVEQAERDRVMTAKVSQEQKRMDDVSRSETGSNSSAEFSAMLRVISTQLYAQVLAFMIFLGLFLIDVLPLTLRLFVRPGPYDAAKHADDAERIYASEYRWLQKETEREELHLVHRVRQAELRSAGMKKHVTEVMADDIKLMVNGAINKTRNRWRKAEEGEENSGLKMPPAPPSQPHKGFRRQPSKPNGVNGS